MRILCTGPGTFSGAELKEGSYYEALEADTPTERQNRAFHALVQEFFSSGLHSYPASTFAKFRDLIKRDFGAGFESYKYLKQTESGFQMCEAKTPDEVLENAAVGAKGKLLVWGKLKSWAEYTKKERRETIDRLMSAMIQCGVNTKKFDEIIAGMNAGLYDKP
jgi:hypothetical protein